MERSRSKKMVLVAVLLTAVLGLTLGFAAYSNELKISVNSEVQPLNSLKVLFSSSNVEQESLGENVDIQLLPVDEVTNYPGFSASIPTINNDVVTAPIVSNLKATFVRPGESVTYTLYTHNMSSYDASLISIAFGNKKCTAKSNTSQSLVDKACEEIDISVKVGGGVNEPEAVTKSQKNSASNAISGHVLAAGEYETVLVTLSYEDLSSSTGNTDLNGDFDVTFGDVKLT